MAVSSLSTSSSVTAGGATGGEATVSTGTAGVSAGCKLIGNIVGGTGCSESELVGCLVSLWMASPCLDLNVWLHDGHGIFDSFSTKSGIFTCTSSPR